MSIAVASSPPLAGTAAGEDAGGSRWLAGGVAAELSDLLAAPVGFIRALMLVVIYAQPGLFYVYVLAALLIPRAGRRLPSWSNLIAGARIGLLYLLVRNLLSANGALLNNGGTVFSQGPAVWLPFAGATLFGVVMVLAGGRPSAQRDPQRDRAVVLASLAALAGLGLVALGVQFAPSLRWEWAVGALAVIGGGALVAGGRRTEAALVPVVLLGVCAAMLVSAGVRLQGGFGSETATPAGANVLAPAYRRAIGNLTLNLTAMPAHTSLLSVSASVGIGNLRIVVPAGARVSAKIHVGRGTFEVATCSTRVGLTPRYGLDRSASFQIAGQNPYCRGGTLRPTLRLRILASVGIGTVELTEPPWTTEVPG
jgi:phage shock protein PspC (stress-responsive transcriptional regulator)